MKTLIAGTPADTLNYQAALSACRIPFRADLNPSDLSLYDRLILPGGGDIHPSWFGQPDQGSVSVDPELDRSQFRILDAFVRAGRPVLGICRGLQIINVYFGGTILQDLPTSSRHRYLDKDQYHMVRNISGSLLHALYGPDSMVNSAHHQGCGRTGAGLAITQLSSDGVVEGLSHTEKPILGVQWHPERTGFSFRRPGIADGGILMKYFLEQM